MDRLELLHQQSTNLLQQQELTEFWFAYLVGSSGVGDYLTTYYNNRKEQLKEEEAQLIQQLAEK